MSLGLRAAGILALGVLLLTCSPAQAQVDLISPATLSGQADLRFAASDGETSWLDGGFGKTRYGGAGAGRGWAGRAQVASADLVWRPSLAFDLTGYVDAVVQPGQTHGVDLSEAFMTYKPLPRPDGWRWQVKAGLLYPDISLENDGPAWTPTRTITPSAINSWVGEEVKMIAAEATVARRWSDQQVSASVAIFSHDDTSGTLLSWRGWALHDVRSTGFGYLPIPQVPLAHKAFSPFYQAAESRSLDDIDGRPGFYGRVEWRAPNAVTVNAFYYDNAGDRTSVKAGQWAWDTKFWNLGARWKPQDETEILAQAMTGRTITGYPTPRGWRVDASFDAAYLLLSQQVGHDLLTGRVDVFDVRDHSFQDVDDNAERGWALAADWKHPFSKHLSLMMEVLHVSSNHPSRAYVGVSPTQAQTTVQTALKLSF